MKGLGVQEEVWDMGYGMVGGISKAFGWVWVMGYGTELDLI